MLCFPLFGKTLWCADSLFAMVNEYRFVSDHLSLSGLEHILHPVHLQILLVFPVESIQNLILSNSLL